MILIRLAMQIGGVSLPRGASERWYRSHVLRGNAASDAPASFTRDQYQSTRQSQHNGQHLNIANAQVQQHNHV